LTAGIPGQDWQRLFAVPREITPSGFAVDSQGRCYISDASLNRVFQFDARGKRLHTFGRRAAQRPGRYDPAGREQGSCPATAGQGGLSAGGKTGGAERDVQR
jgi:streptogramin lyase